MSVPRGEKFLFRIMNHDALLQVDTWLTKNSTFGRRGLQRLAGNSVIFSEFQVNLGLQPISG